MINLDRVIEDTQQLIRIDSQNPGIQESGATEWVGNRLSDMGLAPKLQIVEPGRENVIAEIPGDPSVPRLVLLAHLDTVPIGGGWTEDPLGGEIKGGFIFGRGACDMKGGVAISLGLMEALQTRKAGIAGDVVFVGTVDEEAPDMLGAQKLVAEGLIRPDDQVLAMEPTGTKLRIAQMGLRWLRVNVTGRMAHAGRAHLGIDSAHVMARIVDRLKTEVAQLEHEDEILGRPRFTCGTFHSGVATNVVPPSAEAYFDMRIVPPMHIEDVIPMVSSVADSVISEFPGAKFEVNPLGAPRPPVRASDESKIVTALRASYESQTGKQMPFGGDDGHEAYTDSSMVAALTGSKSCTVFGPGSTDRAHTADEFVPIADLELVSKVIWQMADNW
ncbi:MAG: M20/M25/M40 family metallo-hydrolase [Actinobacteria bacterium]|nr:M20/M25/M40 family metallo-hydrolase [Actinomycetota bacterium]